MITITPAAAEQIRTAATQSGAGDLLLRIAARRSDSGEFEYGMGFDQERESDSRIEAAGVTVLIGESSRELLAGATLDYVELNPGEHRFIFSNPNDPAHRAPKSPS